MTKGIHEPFYNKGFDEAYLAEKKLEWVEPKEPQGLGDVIVNIIEKGKANRITQVTIANMALAKYQEGINPDNANEYYNEEDVLPLLRLKKRKIIKIVVELLKEYKMSCNYRQVANICQDVWCSVEPQNYIAKIMSML